jgi:hypothetical protein
MSDIHPAFHDSLRRQLAAVNCVAPIVDCIRKMRVDGLADNEIAGLLRHTADELDETTMTGKSTPPLEPASASSGSLAMSPAILRASLEN